jgi:hypothetical protein
LLFSAKWENDGSRGNLTRVFIGPAFWLEALQSGESRVRQLDFVFLFQTKLRITFMGLNSFLLFGATWENAGSRGNLTRVFIGAAFHPYALPSEESMVCQLEFVFYSR